MQQELDTLAHELAESETLQKSEVVTLGRARAMLARLTGHPITHTFIGGLVVATSAMLEDNLGHLLYFIITITGGIFGARILQGWQQFAIALALFLVAALFASILKRKE
jgi:hypothetical protein